MLLSSEDLGGVQVRTTASGRAQGAQDVGQGGRTPWEPGVGERDRLRGPDSLTGVRIAGRSDMNYISAGIAQHVTCGLHAAPRVRKKAFLLLHLLFRLHQVTISIVLHLPG